MTTIQKNITNADHINRLQRDPIYQQTKKDALSTRSWDVRLVNWMDTGNTLSKVCRVACVVFTGAFVVAMIHDALKKKEIQKEVQDLSAQAAFNHHQTLFNKSVLGKKENLSSIRHDPNIDAVIEKYGLENEADRIMILGNGINDVDPMPAERSAAFFAMLNDKRTGYADLEREAGQAIKDSTGLDNIVLQPGKEKVTGAKKNDQSFIEFKKRYKIVHNNIPLGKLTLKRNFNPKINGDTASIKYKLNNDKLAQAQQVTERFTHSVDRSTYSASKIETVLRDCAKDFIQSQYKLDCVLRLPEPIDPNLLVRTGLQIEYPNTQFNILDSNTQQPIGTIKAKATIDLSTNKMNVQFEVTRNTFQMNQIQQAQQDKRIQTLIEAII